MESRRIRVRGRRGPGGGQKRTQRLDSPRRLGETIQLFGQREWGTNTRIDLGFFTESRGFPGATRVMLGESGSDWHSGKGEGGGRK